MDLVKEKPKCPICLCEPFLPVTWNKIIKRMERGQPILLSKCKATSKNPLCVTGARDYLNSQIGEKAICPMRCCDGYKGLELYQTYGDIIRNKTEFAEDCMWT